VEFKLPKDRKLPDANRNLADEEIDKLPNAQYDREFWRSLEKFEKVMTCSIEDGYHLYNACLQAGYDPEKDGRRITYWLANRLGEAITAHESAVAR
jgi:hypothetical protein